MSEQLPPHRASSFLVIFRGAYHAVSVLISTLAGRQLLLSRDIFNIARTAVLQYPWGIRTPSPAGRVLSPYMKGCSIYI